MKERGFWAGILMVGLLAGCTISVPLAIPSLDRTPSAPFETLDRPIGLSIPLYLDKEDYYLGIRQTTKVRVGDRLIVWDWKSESVKGTTFVDWSYRSLDRGGMAGPVTPRTYAFWGAVTSPAAGLVFGSPNNSLSEVLRLDAKTGSLTKTSVPGLAQSVSPLTPDGKMLLAEWVVDGTVTSSSLRVFDLNTSTVSTTAWLLGTHSSPAYSWIRPAVFDGQRFWVVRDLSGDGVVGDQIWRFDPSTNTLDLMYTDDRPDSTLTVLGPGPGGTLVAQRKADLAITADLLVFDGIPGKAPSLVTVESSRYQVGARGFQALGTFYLVWPTGGVTPYSVAAVDWGTGTLSSPLLGVDLPSLDTIEVRGDQVYFFATPDFEKVEGLRLDLTKGQTVGRYSLRFAEIHNP